MKNNFLQEFVEKARNNPKTAFIYTEGFRSNKVSFQEFLSDVYKMNGYLQKKLTGNNVLIFSYPYSYLFFVGIFSCVFLGKNLVIIDSFSDRNKTRKMLELAEVTDILTDRITSKLTFLLPGKNKTINLSHFYNSGSFETARESSSIITFTSGTTGIPKVIKRNIDFLESQITLIRNNADIRNDDITYGLLPMYSLLSVLMNNTCFISKRINDCEKYGVTMLLAPIKKIRKIKKPVQSIKRTFLGGAILYKKETQEILSKLPNAEITYVYGASEGAVIYKTSLKNYAANPFTFDSAANGIAVTIMNPDKNGAGEIVISGETVIGENHTHNTGDYGKVVDGKLLLLGRKKYSCGEKSFYNYEYDEYLRKENPEMKDGFSFYFENSVNVAYCGKVKEETGVIYHRFRKLPYDLKHKTKLDYGKVIEKIKK
ncbi:MAG: acyl--CoA ligase [Treponema sp.]|nr:acyl--CoA ligase [Treponema sp.]